MKYIDLFAGIGGFHQALLSFNGECVFASEIDKEAIRTYKENYGVDANHNIREVNPTDLPDYELLCGGFPCQTFSKAGKQEGFANETKGTLFFEIERLLQYRVDQKNPVKYILLENVANLATHDKGRTLQVIREHLEALGYVLPDKTIIMSPHQLGVPQLRNRTFILGVHSNFAKELVFNELPTTRNVTSIKTILDNTKENALNEHLTKVLTVWDEFMQIVKDTIGFPIWVDSWDIQQIGDLPKWKQDIIRKNQELYQKHKDALDLWLQRNDNLQSFTPTQRKFEWQAGTHISSIKEGITQFRPSGVRVKRPTESPTLVAIAHTPVIYQNGVYRYLTYREVARLQSFPDTFIFSKTQTYKQFGNSVNVDVIKYCLKQLLRY